MYFSCKESGCIGESSRGSADLNKTGDNRWWGGCFTVMADHSLFLVLFHSELLLRRRKSCTRKLKMLTTFNWSKNVVLHPHMYLNDRFTPLPSLGRETTDMLMDHNWGWQWWHNSEHLKYIPAKVQVYPVSWRTNWHSHNMQKLWHNNTVEDNS